MVMTTEIGKVDQKLQLQIAEFFFMRERFTLQKHMFCLKNNFLKVWYVLKKKNAETQLQRKVIMCGGLKKT